MMTVLKLGPTEATRTSASKIVGMDREMSTSRMSRPSIRPPKYPEIRPSAVPTMPPTKTAIADTVRDTRAPWISRLRMSRPSLSVPRRWAELPPSCQTGGLSRLASDPFSGSCGATYGANTAGMTSRNMRIESATTGYRRASRKASAIFGGAYHGRDRAVTVAIEMPPSPVADSRVEVRVEDVDQEVGHDEDGGEHDHDGLDNLVVPSSHGVDRQEPGSGPGENALGHDGSRHQDAGDDREERQRGDRRIPEPESRQRLPEQGDDLRPAVPHGSLLHRGQDPDGQRDQGADEQREAGKLERRGEAIHHEPHRRVPGPLPRHAEVALQCPCDEDAVLDMDRLIEPPVLCQPVVVLLRGLHRQHDVERVAAQPGQGEHDQAHDPDGQEALQYPSRDISLHAPSLGPGPFGSAVRFRRRYLSHGAPASGPSPDYS